MISCSYRRNSFLLVALLIASCGSDSGSGAPEPDEPLALTATDAPFDIGSAEFYEGVAYGPHEKNRFDIYLPESDEPTPLLIWIHGGGFTGGSRDSAGHEGRVLEYLAEGVAYASISYRLLESPDPDGVIKPLSDSTRALQFIRYHANQLNIDRDNVILMGGSAGAGTALWIAFNDEMADPTSEDPVEQHSTRVTAAIAIATQATYDIGKWTTVVFEEYDLDLLELADALGLSQSLLDFYGITEIEDFEIVTSRKPSVEEEKAMRLSWRVVAHMKSNGIVICDGLGTVGIGAGQMSRVDSCRIAVDKARREGMEIEGASAGSDAFFPFPDGVEALVEAGVRCIVQPGGSMRDDEVIAAAEKLGITMAITGRRHFRH